MEGWRRFQQECDSGGEGIARAPYSERFRPGPDLSRLQRAPGDPGLRRGDLRAPGLHPPRRSGADREDAEALGGIFLFVERGAFELAVSANSLQEVAARADPGYLQWAFDVLDHWESCVRESEEPFAGSGRERVRLVDTNRFGYLSTKDAALIRDAVLLECDTFLTLDRKLARNADHMSRELGLEVLRPPELYEVLRPHLCGL